MIPPLEDGVLPEGIHDCTIDEIEAVFGRFQTTDRRIRLTEKLRSYLAEAGRAGIVTAVIVDGSYTTAKPVPVDIDLILVLPAEFDFSREMRPFEYNTISKAALRRAKYPFDVFASRAGSVEYERFIEFFSRTNPAKHADLTSRPRKGLLRVIL